MQTARIAGTPLELSSPRRKSMKDSAISSENYVNDMISMTAYSIGAILGDGHMRYIVTKKSSWYTVELSGMDIEVLERFISEIENLFSVTYSIMSRTLKSGVEFYTVRTSRKIIYDYFHAFTHDKESVPIEIIRADDSIKKSFVAGLFDTDGTVKFTETWNGTKTKKNPRWQLGFSNTKLGIVESLASILASMKVRVGKIHMYQKGGYRTIYTIHPNLRDFIDAGFYFQSRRKHQRLIDYACHVVGSETMYAASLTKDDDIVQA